MECQEWVICSTLVVSLDLLCLGGPFLPKVSFVLLSHICAALTSRPHRTC